MPSRVSLIDRKRNTDISKRSASTVDIHRNTATCSDATTATENRLSNALHTPPAVKYMKKNTRDKVGTRVLNFCY